jgi:hypothetical protein
MLKKFLPKVWYITNLFIVFVRAFTTKVVSSNPAHVNVYSIQLYLIKFVSVLWQDSGFLRLLQFTPLFKLTAII